VGEGAQLGLLFGVAAGMLQLFGYVVYMRDADIEPNPVTWLMFAYGTMLLTALEWDSEATAAELILPLVCSAMAVFVAARCWRRARLRDPLRYWPREWWPEDWRDRAAFQIDLILTALYLGAALLTYGDRIGVEMKNAAVVIFLIAANLTTLSAFFPLIRNVVEHPERERTLPWAIWTSAYALLGLATVLSQGRLWNELMLYPLMNAGLHGMVAYLSRKSRRETRSRGASSRV
jgi:hypothetical protein